MLPESEFLQWIHDRLQHVHNESQNMDYMIRLRHFITQAQLREEDPKMDFWDGWTISDKEIREERERMIENGTMREIETPFGIITLIINPLFKENEMLLMYRNGEGI